MESLEELNLSEEIKTERDRDRESFPASDWDKYGNPQPGIKQKMKSWNTQH